MSKSKSPIWSDLWILEADRLYCSECHALQLMLHRSMEFVHVACCSRQGPNQRPYADLLKILERAEEQDADGHTGHV